MGSNFSFLLSTQSTNVADLAHASSFVGPEAMRAIEVLNYSVFTTGLAIETHAVKIMKLANMPARCLPKF
jgi:hypothetical protein